MMEKTRRGTKRVVEEEYDERGEARAFSELKTSLAFPRQGMRWGEKARNQAREWLHSLYLAGPARPEATHRSTPQTDGGRRRSPRILHSSQRLLNVQRQATQRSNSWLGRCNRDTITTYRP